MLQIYNSLTRSKQAFVPLEPGRVRMYVCGMTVYDYCHLGHARVMVAFDSVARYLRSRGYRVDYVRNITDVDDKIIRRARERDESPEALTERFIEAMHEDAAALGVEPPTLEPRATRSMDDIVAMVRTLVERGYAYPASNGDVYYDVSRFPAYGRLSNKRLEDLQVGARVEVGEAKDDPLDFVLWKAAKPDEPSWPSPWGPGRPGWHIECSAMSRACLGSHFDIHGGGMDLKFPHHENEIAQSEAASGHTFVNYWMHVGFVQVNEEKMSKSLGNFSTVRELLERHSPEVLRLFILASHYRSPLAYSEENLGHARASLERLYTALGDLPADAAPAADHEAWRSRFQAAMDDDFNTAEAMAVFFELAREINRARADGDDALAAGLATSLRTLGDVLGLLQGDARVFLQGGSHRDGPETAAVEALIARRAAARAARDFAEADRIRDRLAAQGVVLEDRAGTTVWRRR